MADQIEERRSLPVIDERQLELFKQFIAIQKEEIDLKGKQLVVREKEIGTEHEYALKALDAQVRDLEADRQFRRKAIAWSFQFGVLLVLLLAIFCGYALWLNKLELVKDIMLQIFGTGGLAGLAFFAARSFYKGRKSPGDESDT